MEDCIFCKIVKGEVPSYKIYENKTLLAFLSIAPVNPGHTLIIPKKHYKMMADTPNEQISAVYIKSKELMIAIKKAMKADYVAVSVVGIEVPHFHVHLIPRYFDDGMKNFWKTKKYKDNQANLVADQIKTLLK